MHTSIHPTTHLDLVRADAAARQRRAATHRFVHEQRATAGHGGVRALVTAGLLLTLLIALGGASTALQTATTGEPDTSSTPLGHEPGRADGWLTTAQVTDAATADRFEVPLRWGYLPGHADGWYHPDKEQVTTTGEATSVTGTRPPRTVR